VRGLVHGQKEELKWPLLMRRRRSLLGVRPCSRYELSEQVKVADRIVPAPSAPHCGSYAVGNWMAGHELTDSQSANLDSEIGIIEKWVLIDF
jgi:hypothetical protein